MREIKFRAYDKKENEMFYSSMYQEKTSMAYGLSNFLSECSDIEDTLMQYTGLKDKNDTEIYKDDLLQDDKDRLFQIVEDDRISHTGYLMCCIKNKSEKDHIQIGRFYEFYSWLYPDNSLEIIGNIYENSELIENEKS